MDSFSDIELLLNQCEEILGREINQLLLESNDKKLGPNSSRDLVAYIKLLQDIKIQKQTLLTEMSDEELQKKLRAP